MAHASAFSLESWTVLIIYGIIPLCIVVIHRLLQYEDTSWKINDPRIHHKIIPFCCTTAALLVMDRDLAEFIRDTLFFDTDTLMKCLIASWTSGILVLLAMAIGLFAGWSKMEKVTKDTKPIPKKDEDVSRTSKNAKRGSKSKKRKKSKTKIANKVSDKKSVENKDEFGIKKSKIKDTKPTDTLSSFLCAAGDELALRCILLPELLKIYGNQSFFKIASICGLISALQNMLYVLATKESFNIKDITPMILVESAAGAIYLRTFFLSWLGWMSSYSWFVVTSGHFTFDRINGQFLGNMLTKKEGVCRGRLWLINGDGVAGCIAAGIYAGLIYLWIDTTQ